MEIVCRLPDGSVVAASNRNAVANEKKSPVYRDRKVTEPIEITASTRNGATAAKKEQPFEDEILDRLAPAIVGMRTGESRSVALSAGDVSGRAEKDYVIVLPRIRVRDKEMSMTTGDFRARSGKEPAIGMDFALDPAFPGKVAWIDGDNVAIRFATKADDIETPFGKAAVTGDEKVYRIRIDAKIGALVRTGPLVGRITDVSEKTMTIDYRNPFGGEPLRCDVAVASVKAAQENAFGAGSLNPEEMSHAPSIKSGGEAPMGPGQSRKEREAEIR